MDLSLSIQELHKLFDIFNEKFYENKLEKPVITIQSEGRRSRYGWCSVERIWEDKEEKNQYEITLCAEYLSRSKYELFETLLHEMVHLYNKMNNIMDTDKTYIRHNKKYKVEAEKHGLIINKNDKKYGWSFTELTEETKQFIDTIQINEEVFSIHRLKIMKVKKENINKLYTYECHCRQQIKSKIELEIGENINIRCGDCNTLFYRIESKRGRKHK